MVMLVPRALAVTLPGAGIGTGIGGALDSGGAMAGVGVADATWNVGSAAGQYAGERDVAGQVSGGGVDPNFYSVKDQPSYGVQSRLSIRALVVKGANGQMVALVKADNYLAQDLIQRRVEQLLDPKLGI